MPRRNPANEVARTNKYKGGEGINPAYRPDYFKGPNPYREYLAQALIHFGLTTFGKGQEFWTLGGTELVEYDYLKSQGLTFASGTYNTVDWHEIRRRRKGVRPHIREFATIPSVWKNPTVISYDSHLGLTRRNWNSLQEIINLAVRAASLSDRFLFSVNLITKYMHTPWPEEREKPTDMWELYVNFLGSLKHKMHFLGRQITPYEIASIHTRHRSQTEMLGFYCLIEK